ncbi:MAG: hypothetical protein Q9160_000901 [Pyrenula sp. 1 TL-2023]
MDSGTLMRLCVRSRSTLSSLCTASRSATSSTSLCRRNLDRRRLNPAHAIYRYASASAPRLQQQAAFQEDLEDDGYPPPASSRNPQSTSPPSGQQTGRFQSPQPAPSDPSVTPSQGSNVLDANQFYEQSPQSRRLKSVYDFVPPSSRNPQPTSRPQPQARTTTQDTSQSTNFEETNRPPSRPNNTLDMLDNTIKLNRNLPTPTTSQNITQSVNSSLATSPNNRALSSQLRLKPSLGCSTPIDINRSMDLQRAILTTERKVKLNKVRLEERQQRFHVRAGQKRKDLKSRRWRALFKRGFQNEVSRIQRMRRQGW